MKKKIRRRKVNPLEFHRLLSLNNLDVTERNHCYYGLSLYAITL